MSMAAYNVPYLVAHPYESHAAAGAVVGLALDEFLKRRQCSQPVRLCTCVLTALAIGTAKEYMVDLHARNWEIAPWGVGAAAALSFRYSF
jgi:hypothetical protein